MDDLDFLKRWEVIATLVGIVFGAVWGFVKWVERRNQARVDRTKDDLERDADTRVGALEREIGQLSVHIADIKQDIGDIEKQVDGLKLSHQTVARSSEVGELKVSIAHLQSSHKAIGQMVDSINRAILIAGREAAKNG